MQRMGKQGLEGALIGTLASCGQCGIVVPGRYSPDLRICESGLWLIQHLKDAPLSLAQKEVITAAIERSM